jgi:phenylacetate-CoA ligase
VRPGTGDPVGPGEVGEVVVTTFNKDYPLIRFGTGDLSAVLPGSSPCGRTNVRIKGWMGRADQTDQGARAASSRPSRSTSIVRPASRGAEGAPRRRGRDRQRPHDAQVRGEGSPGGLAEALVAAIRDVTKLRGEVELVAPGSLPNDGKVIEDLRRIHVGHADLAFSGYRHFAAEVGELTWPSRSTQARCRRCATQFATYAVLVFPAQQ